VKALGFKIPPLHQLLRYPPIFITLFWVIAITVIQWWGALWLHKTEGYAINQLFSWRGSLTPHPDVVIVGVDNKSMLSDTYDEDFFKANPDMALMRTWPFPRKLHGKLVERLVQAGAKVIIFDLLFLTESQYGKEDDEAFARAIASHADHVVLGANYIADRPNQELYEVGQVQSPATLIPDNVDDNQIVGIVNYFNDPDGSIRRAHAQLGSYYSIDGLGIHKARTDIQLPGDVEARIINFVGPPNSFPIVNYYEIFHPAHQSGEKPFYPGGPRGWDVFKNKIVLVGPKGNFMHDEHATPFADGGGRGFMPGVEVHANAISTFLYGNHISEFADRQKLAFILCIGILYSAVLYSGESVWRKFLSMIICAGLYLGISYVLFAWCGFLLPIMPIEIVVFGAAASVAMYQAFTEQMEKRRVSGMLQRYVSKNVADELIKSGQSVGTLMAPQKRAVTVLFSDVRNFTTMTENSEPGPFVQQLNEYLAEMVECVFNNHGTLDKFVGDAVMAVYGNPTSQGKEQDAWCAVKTSIGMRQRLEQLNSQWGQQARPHFRFGIGINHGDVMAGDIGSKQRAEFGVIGDTVNVAARVESLTKEQKVDILITETVCELVKDLVEVELRGDIKVKGRVQPVKVYALLSLKTVCVLEPGRKPEGKNQLAQKKELEIKN